MSEVKVLESVHLICFNETNGRDGIRFELNGTPGFGDFSIESDTESVTFCDCDLKASDIDALIEALQKFKSLYFVDKK